MNRTSLNLLIGMNGRFFESNWRPALNELSFAASAGFKAIQFPGKEEGLSEAFLGSSFDSISEALADSSITAVMEILIFINEDGVSKAGHTPIDILGANLDAIKALPCKYVHWHLAPAGRWNRSMAQRVEEHLVPQFHKAVDLAREHGFTFAFEHNEPRIGLFSSPEACSTLLDAIPDLGLVWDVNHVSPEQQTAFEALISRMTMLHVSDTPWPKLNYHLPLGLGNLDFTKLCQSLSANNFAGPAILEIGGLPKSGGYGRDTDEALINSLKILGAASETH